MAKKQQTSIDDMLGRPSQAQLDTRILVSCLGATKLLLTKVQSISVWCYIICIALCLKTTLSPTSSRRQFSPQVWQ